MIKESTAYLSMRQDILSRTFWDWLSAHTSFMAPLHRYKGILRLDRNVLQFTGADKNSGEKFEIALFRPELKELYYGFDDVFKAVETRNLGLGWKPLRITFEKHDEIFQAYLIINYSLGKTDNEIWMEIIKTWLRC